MLLRAGQSPFEPRLVTVPDGLQTGREPHPEGRVGSRMESPPPDTWTESGLTPVLTESSSSRICASSGAPPRLSTEARWPVELEGPVGDAPAGYAENLHGATGLVDSVQHAVVATSSAPNSVDLPSQGLSPTLWVLGDPGVDELQQ